MYIKFACYYKICYTLNMENNDELIEKAEIEEQLENFTYSNVPGVPGVQSRIRYLTNRLAELKGLKRIETLVPLTGPFRTTVPEVKPGLVPANPEYNSTGDVAPTVETAEPTVRFRPASK